jgi:hypothetical protein
MAKKAEQRGRPGILMTKPPPPWFLTKANMCLSCWALLVEANGVTMTRKGKIKVDINLPAFFMDTEYLRLKFVMKTAEVVKLIEEEDLNGFLQAIIMEMFRRALHYVRSRDYTDIGFKKVGPDGKRLVEENEVEEDPWTKRIREHCKMCFLKGLPDQYSHRFISQEFMQDPQNRYERLKSLRRKIAGWVESYKSFVETDGKEEADKWRAEHPMGITQPELEKYEKWYKDFVDGGGIVHNRGRRARK